MEFRKGYENIIPDFWKEYSFLLEDGFKEIESNSDGSFIIKTLTNGKYNFRMYFEFIEQLMLVTLNKVDDVKALTSFEIRNLLALPYIDSQMKPNGDDYIEALRVNANIVKQFLNRKN